LNLRQRIHGPRGGNEDAMMFQATSDATTQLARALLRVAAQQAALTFIDACDVAETEGLHDRWALAALDRLTWADLGAARLERVLVDFTDDLVLYVVAPDEYLALVAAEDPRTEAIGPCWIQRPRALA
jgi:hypothetical protein